MPLTPMESYLAEARGYGHEAPVAIAVMMLELTIELRGAMVDILGQKRADEVMQRALANARKALAPRRPRLMANG